MKKSLLTLATLALLQIASTPSATDFKLNDSVLPFVSNSEAKARVKLNDINFGYTQTIQNKTNVSITITMRLIGWYTQYSKKILQPGQIGIIRTGGWVPSDVIITTQGKLGNNPQEVQKSLGSPKNYTIVVTESAGILTVNIDKADKDGSGGGAW